jgi:hypothetical protein
MNLSSIAFSRATVGLLIVAVSLFCLWFAWPLLFAAGDSARLVAVFNSDEAHHVELIRTALDKRASRMIPTATFRRASKM